MNLDEYVEKLPKLHRARREFEALLRIEERARVLALMPPPSQKDRYHHELDMALHDLKMIRT